MATIALSKNKRTQVLYRSSAPTQQRIIIAFDHLGELDDMLYVSQVVDETLSIEIEDELEVELTAEVTVEVDDTGSEWEVCG